MSTLELENIKHPDNSGNNLTLTSGGNVGIGTAPSSILHIKPPAFTDSIFTVDSTSTNVSQRINFSANGTIQSQIYDDAAQTKLFAVTNKHIAFGTNNTERMRIGSNGYVGVGTSTPGRQLHVNSGATNVVAKFESTDGIAAVEFTDNAGSAEVGTNAGAVVFYPSGIEKARISTQGYLTTPNQPRVFAQGNIANWSNQSANQVYTAWQTTGANGSYAVGISYDAATGRFTVPVAGTYYIYSARYVRIGPSYNTNAARLNIRKNGGFWVNKHIHSNENIPDVSICIEGLIPMAANDYFTIDDSYTSEHYRGFGHTYLHAYLVG